MRRATVWLLGLGAVGLLSLGGCSGSRLSSARDARAAVAEETEAKAADKKEQPADEFKLPADRTGQLLARELPPRMKAGPLERPDRPAPPTAPGPAFVEPPATLPPGQAAVSRAPAPPRKQVRPRLVIDESFEGSIDEPVPPQPPSFQTQKPAAVPSEDVSVPPPLPVLAQPTLDRVSFADATTEASTEVVLAAPLPRRTAPAPFVKSGVPEPYENRKPLPTEPPQEGTEPVADGPAVPK